MHICPICIRRHDIHHESHKNNFRSLLAEQLEKWFPKEGSLTKAKKYHFSDCLPAKSRICILFFYKVKKKLFSGPKIYGRLDLLNAIDKEKDRTSMCVLLHFSNVFVTDINWCLTDENWYITYIQRVWATL